MLEQMVDEESELISIYYGADVSFEDAKEIEKKVTETLHLLKKSRKRKIILIFLKIIKS